MYNIERFIEVQEEEYEQALEEVQDGLKQGNWMYYIFPQLKGLGSSPTSDYYGIENLAEAEAYLEEDVLRQHLEEICLALLEHRYVEINKIFEYPDDLKLKSSMTLFLEADPENEILENVLEVFFDGERDTKTLELLDS